MLKVALISKKLKIEDLKQERVARGIKISFQIGLLPPFLPPTPSSLAPQTKGMGGWDGGRPFP